jgi:hypothetical protein
MHPDLDRIEEYAYEGDGLGMDRRLVQNCLDLAREVRYWRVVVRRHLSVVAVCAGCDYQIEVDPVDLYRMFDRPKPRCRSCGCVLSVRVRDRTIDSGLMDSTIQ